MRAVLVGAALIAALAAATSAYAQACDCVGFARAFSANRGDSQNVFNREAAAWGISADSRQGIRGRIYDYEKTGDFNPSFCQRHELVCKAARACLVAAATAFSSTVAAGGDEAAAARNGAIACAGGAASILVV